MRRYVVIGALLALTVAALAVPAQADPPNVPEDGPYVNEFEAWNPCLGVWEGFTIVFAPFDHFHRNVGVFRDGERDGWTASGFVMERGRFQIVEVWGGNFIQKFDDVFRHPNGDAFRTVGTFRFVGGAPAVVGVESTCLTGPSIEP